MKAAVYYEVGGPEVFRYEEVADPPLHREQAGLRPGAAASVTATERG